MEIGGKVYWDLDNNSLPSAGEGIDMEITVKEPTIPTSTTVMTDDEGVWRVFVPIRDAQRIGREGRFEPYYETENCSACCRQPDSRHRSHHPTSRLAEGFEDDNSMLTD